MRLRRGAALLVAGVFTGCFRLAQPAPDIREYRLDYPPPPVAGQALPVTLKVAPLAVAAMYDRQPIVYRDDAYTTGAYYYARWMANPGAMLTDMLARDFADSRLYTAVQQAPSSVPSDYQLSGEIEEIEEGAGKAGCAARLRLRALLVRARAAADPVLLQAAYAAEEPCGCNDVRALAQAMSTAMEKVSAQLQQAVYEAIAKDRTQLQPRRAS